MNDLYLKSVFTVIAISLCVIACRGVISPAQATNMNGVCGDIGDPCYVAAFPAIEVKVKQ